MHGFFKGVISPKKQFVQWFIVVFSLVCPLPSADAIEPSLKIFEPVPPLINFKKGNLHAHSLRSDGDSSPVSVVRWYRDHGYQFTALTDHNTNFAAGEFVSEETPGFHVLHGEEVSYRYRNSGNRNWLSVHVNSFCTTQTIGGHEGPDATSTLLRAVQEVRSHGGIAQVNHPNFEFALTIENLMKVSGPFLMEVANQHPFVNNDGRPANPDRHEEARPSTEEIWDALLSAGHVVYGTATDDIHDLRGNPGFTPRRPGRGWVQVASPRSESQDICDALAQGRFYFSTGVEFESITVEAGVLELRIRRAFPQAPQANDEASFGAQKLTTRFIGRGGVVLATSTNESHDSLLVERYQIQGDEMYVRAEVTNSSGKKAWTQPFYIR